MSAIKSAFLLTIIAAAVTAVFNIGMAFADYSPAAAEYAPVATPPTPPTGHEPFPGVETYNDLHDLAYEAVVNDRVRDYDRLFELAQELNFRRAHYNRGNGSPTWADNSHPHWFIAVHGEHFSVYNLSLEAGSGLTLEICYYGDFVICENIDIAR